ncbi:DNA replication regulator sld2 [Madurella mycetomatis]|uniref:DNA replication regulator SLD2 n=1 Tax=Madurella mycetomatis TaxID=100816 RepID=A0A175VXU7_9PEZI|nr:DNA replication regulator sld2 [Madurella mycetomatis]KXX76367.1 DNA replication regulator sld2 [Madurella mycetomatis]
MPHQTMDEQARAGYESRSLQLRAELKKWENDWAGARGGKKPGRDDIKQNADIAQKYKEYNRLRDILAEKIPPLPPIPTVDERNHQHRKRKQSDAVLPPPQTPSKRSKPAQTPCKGAQHIRPDTTPSGSRTPAATAVTPSLSRKLFTPAKPPTSISPTPHKDGRVLGLFDLLAGTPSKSQPRAIPPAVAATPSKRRTVDVSALLTTTPTASASRFAHHAQHSGRPSSSSSATATATATANPPHGEGGGWGREEPLLYTSATTPLHSRHGDPRFTTATTTAITTPTSTRASKLKFSTPAFLRRRTVTGATTTADGGLSRVDEQAEDCGAHGLEEWKVGPLRLPRKLVPGNGRGLSSVVAGLRKMEDEAHADEEEVMREMEMEAEGRQVGMGETARATILEKREGGVGDGQPSGPGKDGGEKVTAKGEREVPPLLSGFDDEALYDSPDDEEDRRQNGQQPPRMFKKRGQKRTTRLVNMRPTRAKRPAQTAATEDDEDTVHETQFNMTATATLTNDEVDELGLSDPDIDDSDGGAGSSSDDEKKTKQKKQSNNNSNKNETGVVKRAVRKVKATAHANFKRLKLRNSGAKGGPGHNSRWRRRR